MSQPKRVYLAGPMNGYKDYNFDAFIIAARELREKGYAVFSPAENDFILYGNDFLQHPERFNPRESMADDLYWISKYADAIALLPGWEKSRGTNVELTTAKYLGLEIIEL